MGKLRIYIRIPQRTLYLHRRKGGLGPPNLHKYYLAARLAQLFTIYFRYEKPDWVQIERQAVPSFTLDFLLWCPPKSRPPILAPTLSHSCANWDILRNQPTLVSSTHPLAHIFHNPEFPPGMDTRSFKLWLDKGLYAVRLKSLVWTGFGAKGGGGISVIYSSLSVRIVTFFYMTSWEVDLQFG